MRIYSFWAHWIDPFLCLIECIYADTFYDSLKLLNEIMLNFSLVIESIQLYTPVSVIPSIFVSLFC